MPYSERLAESYLAAKEAERNKGTAGEDPLFKQIAGDSKEFVGGMPKETWDALSPEWKDYQSRGTETMRQVASWGAAGAGGLIGKGLGLVADKVLPGSGSWVAAGAGPMIGNYAKDVTKNYLDNRQPPTISRDDMYKEYQSTIGRE